MSEALPRPTTPIGEMESRAETVIERNNNPEVQNLNAAAEREIYGINVDNVPADIQQRIKRIAERRDTAEVQALNDRAEMQIYGSRGRTYLNPAGEVIADADHVSPGILDTMRGDPRYGRTPEDRDTAVEAYRGRLQAALDNGLELAQAKLLADLSVRDITSRTLLDEIRNNPANGKTAAEREEVAEIYESDLRDGLDGGLQISQAKLLADFKLTDDRKFHDIVARHRRNGMTIDASEARAHEQLDHFAAQRERLIRERNIFSLDEYNRAVRNRTERSAPGSGEPAEPVEPVEPEPTPEEREQAERLVRMQTRLTELRNDYVRRVAGRDRRSKHFRREFRASGVDEAREAYEAARDELGGIVAHLYNEGGASTESILIAAWGGATAERKVLVDQIRAHRLLATGGNRFAQLNNADGTISAVRREQGRLRGAVDAFYGWYAQNSLGQGRGGRVAGIVKNSVAVGALGLGSGIAVGMLAGAALPVGAGLAAGFVANRITKSWMAGRIRAGARASELLVNQRSRALTADILADFDGLPQDQLPTTANLTGAVTRRTGREVRGNRIREGVSTAATALGALGLEHLIAGYLPDLHLDQRIEHLFGGEHVKHVVKHAKHLAKSEVPGETPLRHIDLKGAEYPWDWAANRFGADQATPELLELVKKAQEAGINVQTHPLPGGRFDISVNGNTNTQYVVDWLDRFVHAKK